MVANAIIAVFCTACLAFIQPKRQPLRYPSRLLAEEASDLKFTGTTRGDVNRKVTLLPIVQVVIRANGKRFETLALLDGASEVTMICEEVVKPLSLSGRQEIARIGTWHAEDPSFKTTRVACEVAARDDGATFPLSDCYTVPSLNLSKRPVSRNKLVQRWPHLSGIPFVIDVW